MLRLNPPPTYTSPAIRQHPQAHSPASHLRSGNAHISQANATAIVKYNRGQLARATEHPILAFINSLERISLSSMTPLTLETRRVIETYCQTLLNFLEDKTFMIEAKLQHRILYLLDRLEGLYSGSLKSLCEIRKKPKP
jgi:hypothetical protein